MDTVAQTGELFDLAISLELAAETFYRGLAKRFADLPEVFQFWKHYADEEAGHARWLVDMRDKLDPMQLRQPLDRAGELAEAARSLLRISPEEYLQQIHDLDEAYNLAIKMETAETNTIFTFLVTDFAISHRSRDFLREQIHEHAEKIIREFPAGYRETKERQAAKAQED